MDVRGGPRRALSRRYTRRTGTADRPAPVWTCIARPCGRRHHRHVRGVLRRGRPGSSGWPARRSDEAARHRAWRLAPWNDAAVPPGTAAQQPPPSLSGSVRIRRRLRRTDQSATTTPADLPALAAGRPRLVGVPLVGRALLMRGTSALAGDLALLLGRHRGEPAAFLAFCSHCHSSVMGPASPGTDDIQARHTRHQPETSARTGTPHRAAVSDAWTGRRKQGRMDGASAHHQPIRYQKQCHTVRKTRLATGWDSTSYAATSAAADGLCSGSLQSGLAGVVNCDATRQCRNASRTRQTRMMPAPRAHADTYF